MKKNLVKEDGLLYTTSVKLTLLKFCHGVEIGAYWAYQGHYRVTQDPQIRKISKEELKHMVLIRRVLISYGTKPNIFFNAGFYVIGKIVFRLCFLTPHLALDLVAGFLEKLNIVSYFYMAQKFPEYASLFEEMQANEASHEEYFLRRDKVLKLIK